MSLRVLIVEDNDVARRFLVRVVRDSFSDDLVFDEAHDCESARRLLDTERRAGAADPYRLILCDLEQPQGGSIELLADLVHHPAIKIATTLHSDDEYLFPAVAQGVSGYLLKEDRFEVLVEELQKVVKGHPPLSPAIARRMLGHFRAHQGLGSTAGSSGFGPIARATGSPLPGALPQLSHNENEVLNYISKGFTLKEVARHMGVHWFAVSEHIRQVYRKLAQISAAIGPAAIRAA